MDLDATAARLGVSVEDVEHVLVRVKHNRRLPILRSFGDGSYLSQIGAVPVRVIDCQITLSTSQGRHTAAYRLVTTLTSCRTHPTAELIRLYHERWEIETTYLEIKSTLWGGRVLRASPFCSLPR